MLIYSKHISPRLQYVIDVVFNFWWKTTPKITQNKDEFMAYTGAKISYGTLFKNAVNIPNTSSLLFKKDITSFNVEIKKHNNYIVLFPNKTNTGSYHLSFDFFSAVFYQLSRYEEYTNTKRDRHNRFLAVYSLAFQYHFVDIPVVNYWLNELKTTIQRQFPNYKINSPEFRFIDTIDVDNAFAFKGKGLIRNLGGFLRNLKTPDWALTRLKVLSNMQPDPFDTFEWHINTIKNKAAYRKIYFFLVGNYSTFDKNVPFDYPLLQQRINVLKNNNFEIGLHPSYASNSDINLLKIEKERLELLTQNNVTLSRQHFLKLSLPETYNALNTLGIKEDFSLGFADAPGFRAGVCLPFPFYHLKNNTTTDLIIYPLSIMDATLRYYKKLSPTQAKESYVHIINQVKNVNGTLVTLWHNDALSNTENWEGWQTVYKVMLQEIERQFA